MKIKFSTWNMAHWNYKKHDLEAWNYFYKVLDADVLLFQESFPNMDVLDESCLIWKTIGGTRQWGSGIYSAKYKMKEYPFKNNFPGSVVAGEITIREDVKLIVISLYGIMETISGISYSIPNLHRIFSDLTGILENKKTRDRIILGGDLNASLQCDEMQRGNSHRVFFDRLHEFGLVNCFDNYFNDFVQTHRHKKSEKPWQNDYFFISKTLQKKMIECTVLDNGEIRKFSDHNPVVIHLDL